MNLLAQFLRYLYSLLFTAAIPFLVLRLLWRSRKNKAYRNHILERLGFFKPSPTQSQGIWLHAVSLGESIAALPLIRSLQKNYPDLPITITNTTPTGRDQIRKSLGESVFQLYFPFDVPWAFALFLRNLKPKICIIMETELWPNCLWACRDRKIPVLIANARLSVYSMRNYRKLGPAMRMMFSCVNIVAAQSKMDGDRYLELGLDADRLKITGNIKFDLKLAPDLEARAKVLKEDLGKDRFIWIAASTHAGEEEIILETFQRLREHFPNLLLILVPRHPERFEEVEQLIKNRGFAYLKRSKQVPCQRDTAVFLGDTMGELMLLYSVSDLAFVGGSFVPIGGHNTLEAAAAGLPTIVGPHTHNFVEITHLLSQAGALQQVSNKEELTEKVLQAFQLESECLEAGKRARQVVLDNQGAVEKIVKLIDSILKEVPVEKSLLVKNEI